MKQNVKIDFQGYQIFHLQFEYTFSKRIKILIKINDKHIPISANAFYFSFLSSYMYH